MTQQGGHALTPIAAQPQTLRQSFEIYPATGLDQNDWIVDFILALPVVNCGYLRKPSGFVTPHQSKAGHSVM
ncbi:hypothetical protein DPEC_G00234590 [Dallia pectoralis]|uniref:Uncharacterized protein n=1 Tax=Dallia pectoralis TaxID=75939 RepID=A0ACC2FY72_DALPE|nr:hypothetical protein DPEC_G00234590 [Dallia pectoralis]